jgi:tetratricopeptide (TPR) repeat protein
VSSENDTESAEAGDGARTQEATGASDAGASDAPASTALATTSSAAKSEDERIDLPKWNRARVKRKAPKGTEQDAFQDAVRGAGKKAVRSAPLMLGLVVLVAASIGGVIWWTGHRAEARAESTRMLADSVAYRARGRVADVEALMQDRQRPFPRPIASDEAELEAKVQKGLDELHERAPKSAAARMALLVRGSKKVQAREFADAEAAFREFLDAHGPRHDLAYLAHEGILAALEGQGDHEGALAQAEAMLGSEGDFYRDQGLWHKARLLEKLDRTDDALEVYRQYAAEYPLEKSSIAWQQVRRRLSELDPSAVPSASPVSPDVEDFVLP